MTAAPELSVVVLCYNYARYLKTCLDSVFSQSLDHGSFEVILIDDASTDHTAQVAKTYAGDCRLAYIRHSRNLGHIASANEGLARTQGRYILRLDADDRLAEDSFRKSLAIFHEHPDVGLVYGNFSLMDTGTRVTKARADLAHGGRDFVGSEIERLVFNNYICPPTVMVRRAAWQSIGFAYDRSTPYGEDWWAWLRLGLRYPFYYVNDVLAYYRVHPENLHSRLHITHEAECSIDYVLTQFFALSAIPASLVQRRAEIRAYHYRALADIYYGHRMDADCRRCLMRSAQHYPQHLLTPRWWKRYVLSVIPRSMYPRSASD